MEKEKQEKLIEMVENFCDEYLDNEYKELSRKLVEKMGRKRNVPFKRGRLEIWASGIIYALGQNNFLFDKSFEPYITADDICNYFGTKKSTVRSKARTIREMFKESTFDAEFSVSTIDIPNLTITTNDSTHSEEEIEEDISRLIENLLENQQLNVLEEELMDEEYDDEEELTIRDYQEMIRLFKNSFGKKFFEENKGLFWGIYETRPFMQCLFDYANLLWEKNQKEEAINQYKYMLELNPNDNQGVRYSLSTYLLELNRLDEADSLFHEYEEEYSAFWSYNKLLLDIKKDEPLDILKQDYDDCIEHNKYVVQYLKFEKALPKEFPPFYGIGDDSEAQFYVLIAMNAWINDDHALEILKKISK